MFKSILALAFIATLSLSTIVEAKSYSTSRSSSSSSSSRSSSSSSSYSTSKPSTSTSYSTSKPSTSTSYSTSKPRTTPTNSTTTRETYTTTYYNAWGRPNPNATMMNTAIGTFAGMAVYDMITDENGNTVKAAPYYMSGSERVTVNGEISKPVKQEELPDAIALWITISIFVLMLGWVAFFISRQ